MNDGAPAPVKKKRSVWRRAGRAALIAGGVVIVLVGALAIIAAVALRASLPREMGELRLAGLRAEVTVGRDALGVPVIRGKTLEDVCRAQGFVHAQERFFQMDLARRGAAGEIAALLGSGGLSIDREARPLRFRAHARDVIERLPPKHRALLKAYTEGVNAGLADLDSRPPEYWALRTKPEPWREEDSVLAAFLMFRFLNYTAVNEKHLGTMRDTLPPELVEFLTPEVTRWDAPLLVRDAEAETKARAPMKIPGPEAVDLRKQGIKASRDQCIERRTGDHMMLTLADLRRAVIGEGVSLGSNNWAVSGARSKHGGAIVANDMHLGIRAPNTWFRVQLEWEEEATGATTAAREHRRAVGVSLPGTPAIATGTNGHLAWGFTNVEADVQDLIIVEVDPADPMRYFVPAPGADNHVTEPFGEIVETINVHSAEPVELRLKTTRWGVVTDTDHKGRPLVLKWSALEPDKVNLAVFDMLDARTVEDGVAVARRMFIPPQNVVFADDTGRIAWCVCGWLPRRVGFDGKFPHSWAHAGSDGREFAWDGQIDEGDRPCVIDPPSGILFTANNRTLGWPESRLVGTSWSPPDRAHRIGELLCGKEAFGERDLLGIQLDVKAETLEPFRGIVERMGTYASEHSNADFGVAAALVRAWDGSAAADQPGLRILRAFKLELEKQVFGALTAPCKTADHQFRYDWFLNDEPLLRLLEEKPEHLAPPHPKVEGHPEWVGWEGVCARALRATLDQLRQPAGTGLDRTWGDANRLAARHPLSRAVPFLGRWLDLPSDPLPGSGMTVRAQGRGFGASERFVISPGREESAFFHMPGGQSGHFLSPHYTDGHGAWVRGDPTPLLAGEAVKTLTMRP